METRISTLEDTVATLKDQLSSVTAELAALGEAGMTAPESQEGKVKALLARHTPHYRTDVATKDEILLAARWSQLVYSSRGDGGDGITVDGWKALRGQAADEIREGVESMLQSSSHTQGYPSTIARIAESLSLNPDMHFVAHEESGGHFDGLVSIWRCDERRLLVIVWRGTDSLAAAKLGSPRSPQHPHASVWRSRAHRADSALIGSRCADAHSVFKVPWHSREDSAKHRGSLVGVKTKGGQDRLMRTVDDESVSPLPHFGLARRQLMVGKGFLTHYLGERLSERVKAAVAEQLRTSAQGFELMVCGHSLGGAVATLCAYELACLYLKNSVLLITFGSPRTVNTEFANVLARLPNLRVFRVANGYDVVSRVPPSYVDYQHVGRLVWIEGRQVQPPRHFGAQPWQLSVVAVARLTCCVSTGVADHSMDLYLDRLCGSYSWSRYERTLERRRMVQLFREGRAPTRIRRLLYPQESQLNELATQAISGRISQRMQRTASVASATSSLDLPIDTPATNHDVAAVSCAAAPHLSCSMSSAPSLSTLHEVSEPGSPAS